MVDAPEPDRRFSFVVLMVEVEKPEGLFHADPLSSRLLSIWTIRITTIPAMTSVSPAGNELAADGTDDEQGAMGAALVHESR